MGVGDLAEALPAGTIAQHGRTLELERLAADVASFELGAVPMMMTTARQERATCVESLLQAGRKLCELDAEMAASM